MAEALLGLLASRWSSQNEDLKPSLDDATTTKYLQRLSTLQLSALETTEPQGLAQHAHSNLLSIQALSSRSSKSIIQAADSLQSLEQTLPELARHAARSGQEIEELDKASVSFADRYSRSSENQVLDRRKRALLMARNMDRMVDLLEMPTLLATAVSSANHTAASSQASYAAALDLHSHIRRLRQIYPHSPLLRSIHHAAQDSIDEMKTNLVRSLQSPSVKLAGGMRTIGWIRRIMPELSHQSGDNLTRLEEGTYGALFLVCRLVNLMSTLDALEPLRVLADQETERRLKEPDAIIEANAWSSGQQTERYLKRYIEVFRDQSFAIVSLFKSIFPERDATSTEDIEAQLRSLNIKTQLPRQGPDQQKQPAQEIPSAMATFPAHLVDLLAATLEQYLPNIRDRSSRESLLTQVLYCAGSLGRLGGDFSLILSLLQLDDADETASEAEWVAAMKKHRALAGRLDSLASSGSQLSKSKPRSAAGAPSIKAIG